MLGTLANTLTKKPNFDQEMATDVLDGLLESISQEIETSPPEIAASLLMRQASAYESMGRKEDCFLALEESIRLAPQDPQYVIIRGVTHQNFHELEQSVSDYSLALKFEEIDEDLKELALNNRGVAFYELGKFEDALSDFSSVLSMNPLHDNAFCKRALCHYKLEEMSEAFADLKAAEEINPSTGVCAAMVPDFVALGLAREKHRAGVLRVD